MPSNSQIVEVMPMDGGYITYLRPQLLPDSGFQTCEDALIYRGRLVKRDGYSLLGYLGPLTVAEVVGALGSTSYAHNYVLFPVIPNTVTATDTVVVLNDNGNGGYWQPSINVTGVTQANPGVVTAVAHGYTTGDKVNFFNIGGMNAINSVPKEYFNPFTITVINANTFSIGVDTTSYGAFTAGGIVRKNAGSIVYGTGVATIVFPAVAIGAVTTSYRSMSGLPCMGLCTRLIGNTSLEQLIAFDTTKAYLYGASAQEFVDISGATVWTGNNTSFFSCLNYQASFFATNKFDPIRYYITGTVWTNYTPVVSGVTTLQRALWMFSYQGHMVVLNTTEGGSEFRQRARWSALGSVYYNSADPLPAGYLANVNCWRDDIPGNGGFNDASTGEDIIGAALYKDTMIVFFEYSTWRLRYTSNPALPFAWERINSEYGSESPFSIVPFNEGVLAVGSTGIVKSDFNAVERIDEKIPNTVFTFENNPSTQANRRVHGVRDFGKQLVYWCFPDFKNPNVTDFPDKVLCFNYREETWAIFNQAFTCFGQFTTTADITWRQLDKFWLSYNQTWESFYQQSGVPTVVAGGIDGRVFELGVASTDINDIPFSDFGPSQNFGFEIVTKNYNPFYKQGLSCTLQYVDFYFAGTEFGEFSVDFYLDDDLNTAIITKVVSTVSTKARAWGRVYVNLNADFITMRIYLSNIQQADAAIGSAGLEIEGWQMYFNPGGRL